MRAFFLLLTMVPAIVAGPIEVFSSCAYTSLLPSRTPNPKSPINILIEPRGDSGIPGAVAQVLPQYRTKPGVKVTIKAQFAGYQYLFQDPPDPTTLVFPDPNKGGDNKLTPDVAAVSDLSFTSTKTTTLMVGVTPTPVPDFAKMSADQVRQYFKERSHCGTFALEEKQFAPAAQ